MMVKQLTLSLVILLCLPLTLHASPQVYTVQASSFKDMAHSLEHYDSLVRSLEEKYLHDLRIEKIGQHFSVRIGKFQDLQDADAFHSQIRSLIPGSVLMKAYIKDGRIHKSYADTSLSETQKISEIPVSGPVPDQSNPPVADIPGKKEGLSLKDKMARLASLADKNDFDHPGNDTGSLSLDDGITAVTMPSADVALSFVQPGRIERVYVSEGELVEENQLLVRQDASAEEALLSIIREQSTDTTQIQAQEASLAQKREYLKNLAWAAERGSATEAELEDAKLNVRIAEFSLQAAMLDHEQSKRKYREAKIRVDSMSIKSPIAGRVEKVEVEVGESVDGLAKVIRIVRTDPLWIDVHVPLEYGRTLRPHQRARVVFPDGKQNPSPGKIIFISTVADAASSTMRIRIEIPNESRRPAGQQVNVLFLSQDQEPDTQITGEL